MLQISLQTDKDMPLNEIQGMPERTAGTASMGNADLAAATANVVHLSNDLRAEIQWWQAPRTLKSLKEFLGLQVFKGPQLAFQKAPARLLRKDMKRIEVRGLLKLTQIARGGFAGGRRIYPAIRLDSGPERRNDSDPVDSMVWERLSGCSFLVRGINHRNQSVVLCLLVVGICNNVEEVIAKTPDGLVGLVGVDGKEGRMLLHKALKDKQGNSVEGKLVMFRPQQVWPVRTERQWSALEAVRNKLKSC